jgi:Fe-S-cluster-containing dehydrogenase component
LLSALPFFRGVSVDELKPLAEQAISRTYRAGELLVRQGEFGASMFVLAHGALGFTAVGEDGTQLDLGKMAEPGSFFGEAGLLGRGNRTATVVALTEVGLLEIEKNRFDRFARTHVQALRELEEHYHARAIGTYLRLHRYFGLLDGPALDQLIGGARMYKYNRDDIVFRQGDRSDTVLVIKDGVLKMVRGNKAGQMSVLAYFNTNDVVGGHDGYDGRPADLVALGSVECISLPRQMFDALAHSHPEVFSRFGKDDMHRREVLDTMGKTVMLAVDDLLREGVEVESLLIINLDRCVRCGNCVRACHERHEFTRLTRRGPIFRRRTAITSKDHEHLLVPSSCRHCQDPECMVGCPTGAIHRTRDGEVDINQNCIGCENCARRCPYGNITMMELAEKDHRDGITKKAIKCNMCKGYEYSNCVYNCPRGAILRVDPLVYFEELATVMEAEALEGLRWQREVAKEQGQLKDKQRLAPRSTTFIPVSLAVLGALAAIILGSYLGLVRRVVSGGTPMGLAYGVFATLCIAFATLLAGRKRAYNRTLGNLEVWTQFHMVAGVLGFLAALAHSGFQASGLHTSILLLVFGLEVVSGVLGQAIYMVVPRILTQLERGGLAKLIEDLIEEELTLADTLRELTEKSSAELRAFVQGPLVRATGGLWTRVRRGYDPARQQEAMRQATQVAVAALPPRDRATAERLVHDVARLADVRAQLTLHRSLKAWLVGHIATTGVLVTLLVVHIVGMLLLL